METTKSLDQLETEWKADGLEFSGFGCQEPAEPWSYNLDDHGVSYGKGSWPFYKTREKGKGESASVRLAPDTAYQSWNTMYALAYSCDDRVVFDFNVHCRKQGMGTLSYRCTAYFTPSLDLIRLEAPEKAREDAARYIKKFKAFMSYHLARRDAGKRKIVTAHDRYNERQNAEKGGE